MIYISRDNNLLYKCGLCSFSTFNNVPRYNFHIFFIFLNIKLIFYLFKIIFKDINSYSNYHKIQPQLNNATTTIPSDNILSNEFSSKLTLNNGFTPIGGDNDVNLMNNTSNEEVNSESDEENFVPFGYEALPQDDEEEDVQENNDFAFQQVI